MNRKAKYLIIFLTLFSSFLFSQDKKTTYELQLDPYYTAFGMYNNLSDKPIPHLGEKKESEIYYYLLKNIYKPRTLVFEASFNPLPYLGTVVKRSYKDFYEDAQLTPNFNYVQAITAGFEEPWAFSIFFGNVVEFDSIKKSIFGQRKGYSGLLFDFGDYHIKDNILIPDKWVQAEIKLKGEQILEKRTLIWSFRIGTKIHQRSWIRDSIFLGIKRSRTDYKPKGYWFENCGIELTASFASNTFEPINYSFLIEKKFPSKTKRYAFSLGLGFVWDSNKKYTNENIESTTFNLILRPNLEF